MADIFNYDDDDVLYHKDISIDDCIEMDDEFDIMPQIEHNDSNSVSSITDLNDMMDDKIRYSVKELIKLQSKYISLDFEKYELLPIQIRFNDISIKQCCMNDITKMLLSTLDSIENNMKNTSNSSVSLLSERSLIENGNDYEINMDEQKDESLLVFNNNNYNKRNYKKKKKKKKKKIK